MIAHAEKLWRKLWGWKPLYWLRSHTFTRYHVVDCRNPEYRWGWCDASGLLLFAPFAILANFMENEFPGLVEWQPEIEKELREIYCWWKSGRKAHKEEIDALFEKGHDGFTFSPAKDHPGYSELHSKVRDQAALDEWMRRNQEPDEKDDEMLARLMKIRGYLWT